MITFSIRLSKELYLWLKKQATRNERSLNKEVVYLLRQLKEKEVNGKNKPM